MIGFLFAGLKRRPSCPIWWRLSFSPSFLHRLSIMCRIGARASVERRLLPLLPWFSLILRISSPLFLAILSGLFFFFVRLSSIWQLALCRSHLSLPRFLVRAPPSLRLLSAVEIPAARFFSPLFFFFPLSSRTIPSITLFFLFSEFGARPEAGRMSSCSYCRYNRLALLFRMYVSWMAEHRLLFHWGAGTTTTLSLSPLAHMGRKENMFAACTLREAHFLFFLFFYIRSVLCPLLSLGSPSSSISPSILFPLFFFYASRVREMAFFAMAFFGANRRRHLFFPLFGRTTAFFFFSSRSSAGIGLSRFFLRGPGQPQD